jgi:transketolase
MNERSKQIRRDTIKLMREYKGNHYGGSFSCVEILIALYDHILKNDDIFILSKGHGCWGFYVILKERGFNPIIEGHPHLDIANGIYATTGSMGHGLPFGIGLSLAKKLKNEKGRVFILMGDGEFQEGTTWESMLIIHKLNLKNIIIIVDNNKIQASDFVNNVLPISFECFNFYIPIFSIDGHDIEAMSYLIKNHKDRICIIANTIKGYGVSFIENNPEWHSKWLDDEMMEKALEELK